ncbi:MAG: alpha/beta hydrolase [Oscillospiraceae bacterium]|nr:alpha/beta hydrolase [Oscillospiraceae bacterium]
MKKWPLRNLLNPVVTRSLLYGTDSFDMEYVLQKIDQIKTMSGKEVKTVWFGEWERKAARYIECAEKAEKAGNKISAEAFYMMTAQCYYAGYQINTDDIDQKRDVYEKLAKYYRKAVSFRPNKVEYIEIPVPALGKVKLCGYIHYPNKGAGKSYPLAITYSGVGSCKEELDLLARPLIDRGIAVLTVDMPGTGATLFDYDGKCIGSQLEAAIDAIADYVEKRKNIDKDRIANYGLCMGGGYSFRASAKRKATKCCVSLFPLFMNIADTDSIPIWMKHGKWAALQYGTNDDDRFMTEMKLLEDGTVDCDFLLAYSADDNWMDSSASLSMLDRATGYKEGLEIDEKPAYVSEETIMHAMPVGEQFHWVKHIASDFIAERLLSK